MITVDTHYGRLKGGQRLPQKQINTLMASLERVLRLKGARSLSLAFIGKAEMTRLNEGYYGGQGVTDVLAFPTAKKMGPEGYLGEVLIYYPKAKKQALARKASVRDEVSLLLVHGVLHLMGYDHQTPPEHAKMFRLQDRILDVVR